MTEPFPDIAGPDTLARPEFSIDELAAKTGSTVRNIRAYQDRGLLPPPERRGRKGIYNDAHLSRLRIINRLLERGYTLSNIGELIESWERGNDIGSLLGLETAVATPWSDELPDYMTMPQLLRMFQGNFSRRALNKAIELDVLRPEGMRFRVPSPRMLHAGAELVRAGIPLEDMLDVVGHLRANVEQASDAMVKLVARHVFDRYGEGQLPPSEDLSSLADLVWRLRPLVEMAVLPEVARAMANSADQHLGDRLAMIMEHLHDKDGSDNTTD
ncbi:MerR family transcriptional regulator [Salinisphaera sp. Q1T1-3]|uniref:MerR family transcriptional regulator n=1 Tax=Salinisphaera sp. Q1T1-3 TaxID=2321229 RepID=UPI000E72D837|nr:MerR family transcriptional regulator [Salinisphaera sp. Q1T1-3]RJS94359.1 MerR family transcriptional regulator [Salinisphaera sp. Q1T1-3]